MTAGSSDDLLTASIAPAAEFAASGSAEPKDASGRVASAMGPLDLHKLSMSDFGDVEQPR